MAAWIESPDWTDAIGVHLRHRLAEVVNTPEKVKVLLESSGVGIQDHPFGSGATATAIWLSVTTHERVMLPALLRFTAQAYPALKPDIAPALANSARPGARWYQPRPPEEARLFGPNNARSLIARPELGICFTRLLDEDYRVLLIRGERGMGKSHSGYFLDHVLQSRRPSGWTLTTFAIEEQWPAASYASDKVGVREFMMRLASAVGMSHELISAAPDQNDSTRLAVELVTVWAGQYTTTNQPRRILFIDGLDRLYLDVEPLSAAIAQLASKVIRGELDMRLVITGYSGVLAGVDTLAILEDAAAAAGDAQLDQFFEKIAEQVGVAVTKDTLDTLRQDTLERGTTLELAALGPAASAVAREYFGASR